VEDTAHVTLVEKDDPVLGPETTDFAVPEDEVSQSIPLVCGINESRTVEPSWDESGTTFTLVTPTVQ